MPKVVPIATEPAVTAPMVVQGAPEGCSDLLERARDDDMDAWAELYNRHYDGLFRHVCFLTGAAATAEDLVQETFARALTQLHRFDGRSPLEGWLHGIATNVVRNHWRAERTAERARSKLDAIGAVTPAAHNVVDGQHTHQAMANVLYDVLETLSPNLREAFILRYVQGLSQAETAARLGISVSNAGVRSHRASRRVRAELQRRGWLTDAEDSR